MKKTVLLLSVLFLSIQPGSSQELPTIIPPSPNAAAFHVYGNTQVNNYTGSPDISIPIYTVKEGELSVPIYLKYTAGNGVKVEEMASWVGLGWTLNTGGAVSRIIRGIADEDETKKGFFNMNELPAPTSVNRAIFDRIANGTSDGEADKFMYNYPGGSGSFFYDTDKNIYLKPKKEIQITHNIGVEQESISPTHCSTYQKVIKDFTLNDEYGNSYLFKDKERSNTINFGVAYSDNRGFPSTWYLRKMENRSKTRAIDFEYDTYAYTLKRMASIIKQPTNLEADIYTETSYISKRLKKISFSQGSVEFVASTTDRKDFVGNKYLDQIIVRDIHDKVIKKINLEYKYMANNALVSVITNITNTETTRLMLSSIQECDNSNNCKNPTNFTYNTSEYLPSRFSKAQDHWGYYNGEISNTTLEPKHIITYYNGVDQVIETTEVGSANRKPNADYAKAGILEQIKYPTGGKTVLDYESHTAVNDEIAGDIIEHNEGIHFDDQIVPFTINSNSNAPTNVKITGSYYDTNNTQCKPKVYIKNINTGQITRYAFLPYDVFLENGNYEAWFVLESNVINTCVQENPAQVNLKWESEDNSATKMIGGVRIKSISDYTSENVLATQRNYNYNDDDGLTSGSVVNIPVYSRITYTRAINSDVIWPLWYVRYVNSYAPLSTSQGSHVGYKKVTISNGNGKEEYYYTTADDYPDAYNGVSSDDTPINYDYFGHKLYPFPQPETDSKDYLRGSLKKNIIYKKNVVNFYEVYEKKYFYDSLNYSKGDISIDNHTENAAFVVKGLKVDLSDGFNATYYNIYTGYNLPSKTIEKQYNDSGELIKTSTQNYEKDSYGVLQHYIPISNEITESDGSIIRNQSTYVFNKTARTAAENDLLAKNALYIPLQTDTYKNSTKLSSQYTIYNHLAWPELNVPEKVLSSKATSQLETRILYHDYDAYGNPLEVSKADGTHIVYIWGYNQTQPIAKIENATYAQVSSRVANLQTLSNADDDRTIDTINQDGSITPVGKEGDLRAALTILRASLPESQVTTYTYDPLIGVTSVTDPRGNTVYYEYDPFNRLKHVKDKDGNILSQNEYNYKN